jgi:hypothetical protein
MRKTLRSHARRPDAWNHSLTSFFSFWNLPLDPPFSQDIIKFREKQMLKAIAAFLLLSSSAFAQDKPVDPSEFQDCPPIGQSAKGELIYGMDCKAIKPENRVEVLPGMPPTNLPNTVIPKSGGKQNPDETPTKGETR